ncbi:putative galactose oxidase precursor [Xylogone sp. PMI_703]|nr:putative galactose oxidase precursor [Xylogone sp. PMI_703]
MARLSFQIGTCLPLGFIIILSLYLQRKPVVSVLSLPSLSTQTSPNHVTGSWEASIPVPLVPAAMAVLPRSGKVLLWAADRGEVFGSELDNPGQTTTAIYDPATKNVTGHQVSNTGHNMFCPGVSLDASGRPIVTGGSTENHTSIFDESLNWWIPGSPMKMGRGYHAQATLSDGRLFTIGGSWSGQRGDKRGEVYDPTSNTWSLLSGCPTTPMLTNDKCGDFCNDNHPWLFAWKNNSVFQAGPSVAMNWYGTAGNGSHVAAGARAQDHDAMNGNAVMYDAAAGKILTLGGSPWYAGTYSTKAAHVVTLSEPFAPCRVEAIGTMHYPRAFANAVVLPTGEVFINGGQSFAIQWTDANATLTPELWNPVTRTFLPMAEMPIPRTYHSTAVLLPDATVLTGGGGLCWAKCADPTANHLDIQVFTPPYLMNPDRSPAVRPRITAVSVKTAVAGSPLSIETDVQVHEFALIRYGSATHSINTDQRRIVLVPEPKPKLGRTSIISQVRLPDDSGILLPGYWMLFAMNKAGVPSIAETILITSA